ARARDRSDIHHRALDRLQLLDQPARQHDRGEEIDAEHLPPDLDRGVERAEPLAAFGLGRDRRVVDQRVQLVALDAPPDLLDRGYRVLLVGEIDLDVVLRSRLPGTVFRERMARAGDHAPARGRKPLDGGVADAAAGSGQEQGTARLVGLAARHGGPVTYTHLWSPACAGTSGALSRIEPRLAPGGTCAPEHDAVVQAERPLLPEFHFLRHDAVARPMRRPRHLADGVFRRIDRDRLLEGEAAFQRRGLLARPGADLRLLGAG